jgi:RHS repeat-associated protein
LLTQTDANNNTTRFEYDRLGRRTKRILPLGMFETFTYDLASNLTSKTDFNGKQTTFTYDLMGRLTTRTPDASTGEQAITFTYKPTGLRETMTDATGTTRYEYDGRNRLSSKETPQGTLSYTYNAAGSVLTVRSSNGNGVSVDYSYDALNRLATVKDNRHGPGVTAYSYDANGNLESVTYPNQVRTSYSYNSLNRLTTVSAALSATTLASYAYSLDAVGNRTSVTEQNGRVVNYTYDALYRLTNETINGDLTANGQASYAYDAVGNRLSRTSTIPGLSATTATYNANNQLSGDTYDLNGNTIGSQGATYAYDSTNRLKSANPSGASYAYDGDGNLVAKTVGGTTTRYLVDNNNPTGYAQIVEELVGGQVQRQYTYGHDLISQRQFVNGQWQTSFYGYDGHGSVRYLTDAAGAISDTYSYDSFGNLLTRTGTTANDYLYAGERFDADVGLYYLRARHMSPSTGRFFTQDTYEGVQHDPLSLHKYLYANANPVNRIDPSGNFSFSIGSLTITLSIQSILVNMAIGAFSGAMLGALDAFLGGRNVKDAAIQGGLFGAALGPFAGLYIIRAILAGVGMGISAVGAFQALMDEDYDLAAFRAATFIAGAVITWRLYIFNNVRTVNPATLRFSQTSAGGNGRAAVLRESMKNNGWDGPPVDVVETPEGLVTIDNTRVAVARELGISEIPVRVHKPTDPLPGEMLTGPNGPRFSNSSGESATTWGEAAAIRGGNQNPPLPPSGTPNPPRLPKQ